MFNGNHSRYIEINYSLEENVWGLTSIKIDEGLSDIFIKENFDPRQIQKTPTIHLNKILRILGKIRVDGGSVCEKISDKEHYFMIEIKPRPRYTHSG